MLFISFVKLTLNRMNVVFVLEQPVETLMANQAADSVVPLRNEKNIVHAAEFIEGEIETLLELQLGGEDAKPLAGTVLALIKAIGHGQSKNVLKKNFDALLAILEKPPAQLVMQRVSSISLKDVEVELKRRSKFGEITGKIQETLLNEQAVHTDRLQTLQTLEQNKLLDEREHAEKLAAEKKLHDLSGTLERMVSAIGNNSRKISLLQAYQAAIVRLEKGLSADIFGEKLDLE